MYKIESVKINGFWHRFDASASFNPDVNIIIGMNGTGKTTFMNIVEAILTVDPTLLAESEFDSASIALVHNGKRKTISATKKDNPELPFLALEFKISQRKYNLHLFGPDERRMPISYRRRFDEMAQKVRDELAEITSVASLSVYRMRHDDEYEIVDRRGTRIISPVDYRLSQTLTRLTEYSLELAQKAGEISTKLQRDVLASMLFGKEDESISEYQLAFNEDKERKELTTAYKQLNSLSSSIQKKIDYHVTAIANSIKNIKKINEEIAAEPDSNDRNRDQTILSFLLPIEAMRKTRNIINLSLTAEGHVEEINSQKNLFLATLRGFITDKTFEFAAGKLVISNNHGTIDYSKLSSGEKQLIILLIEALLQHKKPHIFLADEPELSLHIEWQRKIIPAVRTLNPNAQVLVATHSPEVASKYPDAIFDMEKIVRG